MTCKRCRQRIPIPTRDEPFLCYNCSDLPFWWPFNPYTYKAGYYSYIRGYDRAMQEMFDALHQYHPEIFGVRYVPDEDHV